MKRSFQELSNKTEKELQKDMETIRSEMMKMQMESVSNPQKDSNVISKKKKRLAMVLTAVNQKREMAQYSTKK